MLNQKSLERLKMLNITNGVVRAFYGEDDEHSMDLFKFEFKEGRPYINGTPEYWDGVFIEIMELTLNYCDMEGGLRIFADDFYINYPYELTESLRYLWNDTKKEDEKLSREDFYSEFCEFMNTKVNLTSGITGSTVDEVGTTITGLTSYVFSINEILENKKNLVKDFFNYLDMFY